MQDDVVGQFDAGGLDVGEPQGGKTVGGAERGLDTVDVALVQQFGEVHFPDHGGHDVAGLQIEVVARAIQVGRHYGDEVGAVLQIERLAHLHSGDFGDGVGLVGIFQR